jgi:hypothetical protein
VEGSIKRKNKKNMNLLGNTYKRMLRENDLKFKFLSIRKKYVTTRILLLPFFQISFWPPRKSSGRHEKVDRVNALFPPETVESR